MSSSPALKKGGGRKRFWIITGVSVAAVILIAVGVSVGVVVSKKNKEPKSATSVGNVPSPNSSPGPGNSSTTPTSPDPNDPSNFVKDSRLHRSLYGIAYTPDNAIADFGTGCNVSLSSVIKDIQLMSQVTKRVRLYGAECNQTAMVLEAIKQTKVDMEVFLGNYIYVNNATSYQVQRDTIKEAIQTYGTDHIAGITVGNEVMLNWVTQHGSGEPDVNTSIGDEAAAVLIANVADTREMLQSMSLNKVIPVGNSDAGSFFSTKVLSAIDYGMANVHAWFAQTNASAAAAWVNSFFQETNVAAAAQLPNNPKMYIAETGWPTGSSMVLNPQPVNGAAVAGIEGLQTFLDTFLCEANKNNVPYFYFEFKDEEWKDTRFGGVEGYWGLFTKEKTLKDVTIPDCAAP